MRTKNKCYNHYIFENIVISSPSSLASGSNVLTLVNPRCPLVLKNWEAFFLKSIFLCRDHCPFLQCIMVKQITNRPTSSTNSDNTTATVLRTPTSEEAVLVWNDDGVTPGGLVLWVALLVVDVLDLDWYFEWILNSNGDLEEETDWGDVGTTVL